jgi:hypothetical protein
MNRKLTRFAVSVASLGLVAAIGIAPAHAADPTLTFNARTGTNAVLNLIPGVITVTASVPGKVAFFAKGVAIKDCEAISTAAAAPYTATCTWVPTIPGPTDLTAQLTPTDTSLAKVTTRPLAVSVGTPINQGEGYQPVSVYVDTVNGPGTVTSLAPFLNNASCVIMSQFVRGMTIVFRVYANDHMRDGIPLTSENAKVEVVVPGVANPIALSYGNHSGAAFWAGTLATGEPGSGRYSTLGTINYSINVTLLEKKAVTKTVNAVKYVKVLKNGKPQKVDGKFVYKAVTYKQVQILEPEVKGLTYVYSPSRWPTSSLLTLNALPTS